MAKLFGAIDLGASSGRVIAAIIGENQIELTELHRFANTPVADGNRLFWNLAALQTEILEGLRLLAAFAERHGTVVTSLGIDTWAVDYGLLDAAENLVAVPRNYRDERNALGVAHVNWLIDGKSQFEHNGLQFLPFNTIYQLSAHAAQDPNEWAAAKTMLLMPDLLAHWLTGEMATERTNASTTGLLSVSTHEWDWELIDLLGYDRGLFTRLVDAGAVLGQLRPEMSTHPTLANTVVTVVPSHDTAAAVLGSPLADEHSAYLSSGTWSLLGLELPEPQLSTAARTQNFTNELGVGGRIRFLKNLGGLWLLQQSMLEWQLAEPQLDLGSLLNEAEAVESNARVDVNDETFLSPGEIPAKIQGFCSRVGLTVPRTKAEIVRCILDSLATAYGEALSSLEEITGTRVNQLNVVGGGSQNALLAKLTADFTGVKVLTGPVEATALGNLISQAAAHGCAPASIQGQRQLIQQLFEPTVYEPNPRQLDES